MSKGEINLKIERSLRAKFKALCALKDKTMQERIMEMIEADVEKQIARQDKG